MLEIHKNLICCKMPEIHNIESPNIKPSMKLTFFPIISGLTTCEDFLNLKQYIIAIKNVLLGHHHRSFQVTIGLFLIKTICDVCK